MYYWKSLHLDLVVTVDESRIISHSMFSMIMHQRFINGKESKYAFSDSHTECLNQLYLSKVQNSFG